VDKKLVSKTAVYAADTHLSAYFEGERFVPLGYLPSHLTKDYSTFSCQWEVFCIVEI